MYNISFSSVMFFLKQFFWWWSQCFKAEVYFYVWCVQRGNGMEGRPVEMGNRPVQDTWEYSCSIFPPGFNPSSMKINTANKKENGGDLSRFKLSIHEASNLSKSILWVYILWRTDFPNTKVVLKCNLWKINLINIFEDNLCLLVFFHDTQALSPMLFSCIFSRTIRITKNLLIY